MVSSLDINQRKKQIVEGEGLPSSEPTIFPSELACCLSRVGRHENERSDTDHESQDTLRNVISAFFTLLKMYVPQSGKSNAIQNSSASLRDATDESQECCNHVRERHGSPEEA